MMSQTPSTKGRVLLAPRFLLVTNGATIVNVHYRHYGKELAKYNKRLELLDSPYVIRQRHYSKGRLYSGRYYYRRYYDPDDDCMKQKYVGLEIPLEEAPVGGFPPCPDNPLDGLECQLIDQNVILTEEMYLRFIHIFEGHIIIPVLWE